MKISQFLQKIIITEQRKILDSIHTCKEHIILSWLKININLPWSGTLERSPVNPSKIWQPAKKFLEDQSRIVLIRAVSYDSTVFLLLNRFYLYNQSNSHKSFSFPPKNTSLLHRSPNTCSQAFMHTKITRTKYTRTYLHYGNEINYPPRIFSNNDFDFG